ncbi:carboxypeptidase regulatory-like domain-containing protein [Flavihumibacter rivuli]|uniref:TonB-dependent receptor n=1 Tax=Flavihumibacter rivuli TaxID=2838156 RepID=UPI001BDEAD90|nr:carboxypeptidase regulatory-like domain-containing protein [Flavihumibacter rivuli]ULQ57064.1 carboxypeptidase regulatory-like domain-containing protein [Flavihumibacter rivuli]
MSKRIVQVLTFLLLCTASFAQVTSGTIIGFITDNNGKGLAGASIEAVHEPSGTRYRTLTTSDGKFNLPSIRIGGPYKVTISYVGYNTQTLSDITVQLGEPTRIDAAMVSTSKELQEVVVATTKKGSLISKDRKGTASNFNRRMISSVPTLSRSITDVTKFTPQANGTSFAGQDNRFINLTIDGSIFNNSFGLQALPGSQTNSTPISLDAIEEIQVNVSPYSLKDAGFTGASINAVTRSGTNTFHGSAFYNMRNEGLVGRKAGKDGDQDVVTTAFDVKQFGASIGGPIIKNKLFFFANYEGERRNDPGTTFIANDGTTTGGNVTRVKESDLEALSDFLINNFNYNPGPYQDYSLVTKSDKALVKFDWNISDVHKLSVRGNILKSVRDVPVSNSGGFNGRRDNLFAMTFANSNYEINNDIYSGIIQLNSRISNKFQNDLIVGYTANRDYRNAKAPAFPTVDILDGNDRNYITFGSEPFTPNNILNTDTWQFSDNLTFYSGKHTISAGVNFEAFKFFNQFTPTIHGQYVFHNLDSFYASANAFLANPDMETNPVNLRRYALTYSNLPGGGLWNAVTKAYNLGFYIQDEVTLDEKLSLTYGARFDIPFFGGSGFTNTEVDGLNFVDEDGNPTKLSTSQLPSAKLMISPRIGFNYDVAGNKKTQIRGGFGLFAGRPAFVWISNQIGNNGVQSGSISTDNTRAFPFNPDVTANIPVINNPGSPAPSYNIATTEKDFRFPQVFRTNLGIDQNIGGGIIASAEVLFTQSLSNVFYYNANLKPATGTFSGPDNRPRYGTFNPATGQLLSGSAFNAASRINTKITDATVLKSGPLGQSFMATFKVEKPMRAQGFGWMVAYNFGRSRDYIQAGSIAFSSWRDNRSVRGNNSPDLAFSDNDLRHRVIGQVTYRKEIAKTMAVQFTLAGQSQNQGRTSYTYSGDMNGDGIQGNDLLYIPASKGEMNFQTYTTGGVTYTAQQQADAFEAYINQDAYLSSRRGKYAERNGVNLPMVTRFDLSGMLEVFRTIGKQRHTIQLRADIFNVGNMINSAWGVGYVVNNNAPLAARGYDPATGVPIYRMNLTSGSLNYETYRRGTSLIDVWQAQFGIRYIF